MMKPKRGPGTRRFGVNKLKVLGAVTVLALAAASCAPDDEPTDTPDTADTPTVTDPAATDPDPITIEMLTPRAEFTDEVAAQFRLALDDQDANIIDFPDASHIAVAEVTIQPEAIFPWHTHPGMVIITVAEGDFVYVLAEDCVQREYSGGEALIDSGEVHTAFNPSETDVTVVIATFLAAPGEPDQPLTEPVDEEEQEELTEQCDL